MNESRELSSTHLTELADSISALLNWESKKDYRFREKELLSKQVGDSGSKCY